MIVMKKAQLSISEPFPSRSSDDLFQAIVSAVFYLISFERPYNN
jgi:hypothetical protein